MGTPTWMASDYEDFDENFDEDFDEDSHEFAPFDVALASLEDSDRMVRVSGDWITLRQLEPAALAQHAEAVVARLEDSELQVRVRALDTLAQLEPAALAQHAEAVVASLEDSELQVRVRALTTLAQLEPSALTQHAEAVVARLESMMLEDLYIYVCIYIYIYIYIYTYNDARGPCGIHSYRGVSDAVQAGAGGARAARPRIGLEAN